MKHKNIFLLILLLLAAIAVNAQSVSLVGSPTGNEDCIAIGDLGIGTTYTAEAWVYPTELTGAGDDQTQYGYTVFASSVVSGAYPLWVTLRGTEVRVWSYELTATAFRVTTGANISINNWYHIAVSATKGGTTIVYVNGVNRLQYTNDNESNWNSIFTIGALRPTRATSNIPFAGQIDEVRIWNDIRTADEINANMNNEINTDDVDAMQGLVGYWRMNDLADPTEDLSGNNFDGDLLYGASFGQQKPGLNPPVTLPVELSSFTAVLTAEYFVELKWITQSETDVSGYYIYRNTANDVSNATMVSPFIPANNTSTESQYIFVDNEVLSETNYYYWLQHIDMNGDISYHGPVTAYVNDGDNGGSPYVPLMTSLQKIYPNPFHPTTIVSYGVKTADKVTIDIYNIKGEKVRSLVSATKAEGTYRQEWNGKDDRGITCPSGVYYLRMTAGKYSSTHKLVMMK